MCIRDRVITYSNNTIQYIQYTKCWKRRDLECKLIAQVFVRFGSSAKGGIVLPYVAQSVRLVIRLSHMCSAP